MMSLHHCADLGAMLAEIARVLAPGGHLLIREHNCGDKETGVYLDVVHAVYAVANGEIDLQPGGVNYVPATQTYRSRAGWDRTLGAAGFKYRDSRSRSDMFRSYFAVYSTAT